MEEKKKKKQEEKIKTDVAQKKVTMHKFGHSTPAHIYFFSPPAGTRTRHYICVAHTVGVKPFLINGFLLKSIATTTGLNGWNKIGSFYHYTFSFHFY